MSKCFKHLACYGLFYYNFYPGKNKELDLEMIIVIITYTKIKKYFHQLISST